MNVAQTIANQIGGKALYMMGVGQVVGSPMGVSFKIKGSKVANYVKVTLTASDLYDVGFYKVTKSKALPGFKMKVVAELEGVYADQLKTVLESNTGLLLKLF